MDDHLSDRSMSAIYFKFTGEKIEGYKGDDRILITWNGKFLPLIEQTT